MLTTLEIPNKLSRNHPSIGKEGAMRTGRRLMEKTARLAGLESLAGTRVLDIGCGTRFTSTIVNNRVQIGHYTGVDVDSGVITFLKENVEARDERFDYGHWDVTNALYNKEGKAFDADTELPVEAGREFDIIWMFSVITHQYPEETSALFHIARRHVAEGGRLIFTAFTHPELDKFVDWREDKPLMEAYYEPAYLLELLDGAGWRVDHIEPKDTEGKPILHQDLYFCSLK